MKRHFPLLLLLVLLGALAASQVATAASPSRPTSPAAHPALRGAAGESEAFVAEEGEEFEFEECEAGAEEFEFEEGEEFEEEELEAACGDQAEAFEAAPKGAPFVAAPASCLVRQAESTITALPGSDEVRLSVRYRTWSPTQVTVGLRLKDRKGSVAIGHTTKHLGAKGVLHLTTKLGAAVMDRALTASEFDVSLRAPETPGTCAGALEQRLHTVKHTSARAARVYAG